MAKMTEKQAVEAVWQAVAADVKELDTASTLWNKAKPKLNGAVEALEADLKKGETGDFMQVTLSTMQQSKTDVARALPVLTRSIKAVVAFLKSNPEVAAAVPRSFMDNVRYGVEKQEEMRNLLRRAKEAEDKAEAFIARQGKDSDAAAEDWSAALALFDGACRSAVAEAKTLAAWEKSAQAAAESRNRAALEKLVKAVPACPGLDAVAAMPSGSPFRDFDKQYDIDALSTELQDEISLDRGKAMNDYERTLKLVAARDEMLARVRALKVDARDASKALKVLDLPKTAMAKLQAALDGPESAMVKSLETLAKACGMQRSGKDMQLALRKAAVI